MILQDVVIKPEKVTLHDGRKGFFFQEKLDAQSTVIVRRTGKAIRKKPTHTKSKLGQSIIKSLKEVKRRRSSKNYPLQSFDELMDGL